MRALLTVIAGGPIRAVTTAAALVVIGAVASGSGWNLLRATWMMSLASCAFVTLYAILAVAADATGACNEHPSPAPKEADHG